MKVLAINATAREQGRTLALSNAALEGAASRGAQTETVLLKDREINFCANCLTCYKDHDSEIAPCSIKDDVHSILESIREADGIIMASPVHSGFVTGLMTTFIERATFTLCSPTCAIPGMEGYPVPRLTGKARASAAILNAGMVPPEMREFCDLGTPWLAEGLPMYFNGPFVGDVYAAGVFEPPLGPEEMPKALIKSNLTQAQLDEARALGAKVADAIQAGPEPFDPVAAMGQMVETRR